MHGRKTVITTIIFGYNAPFSDSEALRPNYYAHAGCYSPIQELFLY